MAAEQKTNFNQLDRVLASIKLWEGDLKDTPEDPAAPELSKQVKSQFLHNVVPFFRSMILAVGEEFSEQATLLASQAEALEEMIEQEEGFLQPEMADNLKATFQIGMVIIGILESESIVLDNELKNRKLHEAMDLFKNNTTILVDQIDQITNEDDDDDDGADVHAEAGSIENDVTGGEGGTDDGGATGDDGAGADDIDTSGADDTDTSGADDGAGDADDGAGA